MTARKEEIHFSHCLHSSSQLRNGNRTVAVAKNFIRWGCFKTRPRSEDRQSSIPNTWFIFQDAM